MDDEPTRPDLETGPDPELDPVVPVAPSLPPPPVSVARQVALGAIVFMAALLLLLGATRLVERGVAGPSASPSNVTVGAGTSSSPAPSAATLTPATPSPIPPLSPLPGTSAPPSGDPVLVGAGDIGDCGSDGDDATAALLDGIAGTVFTAGDNAYENGSADEFRRCYDPNWGRHRARTRPAPGNHDWQTDRLAGYFEYFGASAQGPKGSSWYSYDLGTWHVIVLDSMCGKVGGCDPASAQGQWLAADLAATDATCTLAIFHHPRFSSGEHGDTAEMDAFWRPLHAAGVDVIVNGHDHDYERFKPQDPDGRLDAERGIREFVVGTGGTPLRAFKAVAPNSEFRSVFGFGVIAFTLHDGSYEWRFSVAASDVSDYGTARCH